MQCPRCHNEIDESRFRGLAFCPFCGAPAARKKKAPNLAFCPYCGKDLKEATPFCPQCGKSLPDEYSAAEEGEAAEAAAHQHHDILAEGKEFLGHTAEAVRRSFGRERKVRKLYEQWAEHSDLPEEELATLETEIHHQAPKSRYLHEEEVDYESLARRRQQMPILYILLALAVLIIIAGIILLITSL